MRNLLLLLSGILLVTSCTRDRTQIMLRIRTDMSQGSSGTLGSIRVRVTSEGAVNHDEVHELDQRPLPATLALVPTSEREGLVTVEIEARGPDGTVLFTKPAEARYVPERTLVLDVVLADRCRADSARGCPSGESCGLAGCESNLRDALGEYVDDTDASLPVAMDAGYDACIAQCDGVCVDTNSDPAHCGSCDSPCSAPPGAEATCSLGECGFVCPEGFHACDGMCVDNFATATCGNSCAPCPTTGNGAATCDGVSCSFICEPGFQRGPEGCSPGPNVEPPRPISPLSLGRVTSRRPTFRWALSGGTDGALIQVCRDLECTDIIAMQEATGGATTARLDRELPLPATGSRRVYFRLFGIDGPATGASPSATWSFELPARSAETDTSHGVIYDFNGDGYADLAVGSQGDRVDLYTGAPTGLTPVSTPLTQVSGSGFGVSVAAAGDVDGDGYGDLVLGAPGIGTAYLYRGSASGIVRTPITLTASAAEFGRTVAAAGDVNGDGYADILVGAPGAAKVFLFFGGASPDGSADVTFTGPDGSRLGGALTSLGDSDADGKSDIALGAPGEGKVYVFQGKDVSTGTIASAAAAVTLSGTVPDEFGAALAGALDVDGDGRGDLFVGSPGAAGVRLYLGSADGVAETEARSWASPNTSSSSDFGAALHSAGDVNRDGYDDWIVGAPAIASAYIYEGGPSHGGENPAAPYSISSGSRFGAAVTSTGDVDGNGFDDTIIGAPGQQRIMLYLHGATGLATSGTTLTNTSSGFGGALAAICPLRQLTEERI